MKQLLKYFLTLQLVFATVYGLTQSDSIKADFMTYADTASIGGITRIKYNGVDGIFLTNDQEILTLTKIVLKSIYKNRVELQKANASFYWALYASEKNEHNITKEKLKIVENQNTLKDKQLATALSDSNKAVARAEELTTLNEKLTKDRKNARITAIALAVTTIIAVITK